MSVGPEVKEKADWKISSDTGYTRIATMISKTKKYGSAQQKKTAVFVHKQNL